MGGAVLCTDSYTQWWCNPAAELVQLGESIRRSIEKESSLTADWFGPIGVAYLKHIKVSSPQCAHDGPTVAPCMHLKLVGVCVLKRHIVPKPKNIRRILFLTSHSCQGAVQTNRFPQRGDNRSGTSLKLQLWEAEKTKLLLKKCITAFIIK